MLIYSRRGGATAAILTLDTAVDKSRKKMAGRVARFPARLCSRDGKLCYYQNALVSKCLEYDFLALRPCFLLSYCSPPLSRYASLRRVASFVQQSSGPLQQVRVLVIRDPSQLRIPFVKKNIFSYHVVLIFVVSVFVALSYPVRWGTGTR